MKLQSPWKPWLAEGNASPVHRLCDALANDIQLGVLAPGDRLPAHRDLAYRLSIAVGTVTKCYAQLERRGLVRSVQGRGVFVAYSPVQGGTLIDLSRNAPPNFISSRILAKTLNSIARRLDSGLMGTYPPTMGHDEHRMMIAKWFGSVGGPSDPERLVLTGGAHAALSLAISACCGGSGTLFTEQFTYPGVLSLARATGVNVVGVALDGEGIRPDALEHALKSRKTGPAALYVTPTIQNPTTATMSRLRREEIAKVCRAQDILIIEDDVYALAHERTEPALALLAPERCFYANSFSKTLNPAIRLGGLVAPAGLLSRTIELAQAHMVKVSPILCTLAQQWVMDGVAQSLVSAIREESRRRRRLASTIFGHIPHEMGEDAYHVWVPMSAQSARNVEQICLTVGVQITRVDAPLVDLSSPTAGIRLCIGAPSFQDLQISLDRVARTIASDGTNIRQSELV